MAQILISYRRVDAAGMAGRVSDRLIASYGAKSVFIDIDTIPYGTDFRDAVNGFLSKADILIAVVGPAWRGGRDDGSARIFDPDDPVRIEIETALKNGVPVVPILVAGAKMPAPDELPDSIKKFSFLNAATIDVGRDFDVHTARLIDQLDQVLTSRGKPQKRAPRSDPAAPARLKPASIALIALMIGGGLALPFGGAWVNIAPPWPRGVAFVTVLFQGAVIAFVLQALKSSSLALIHRVWLFGSVAAAVIFTGYLALVSSYTYETPTTKELWAKGYECTDEAKLLYPNKCPNLGIDELIGAEYEAERLWTARSVTNVKIALVVTWLCGFAALGALIGSFAVQQRIQGVKGTAEWH
jgi:hypothetical protein